MTCLLGKKVIWLSWHADIYAMPTRGNRSQVPHNIFYENTSPNMLITNQVFADADLVPSQSKDPSLRGV